MFLGQAIYVLGSLQIIGRNSFALCTHRRYSRSLWFPADILGLFSINVVSFAINLVPRGLSFSANVVPKQRGCFWVRAFMFSGRYR
jgi:hypothetical protein